jgi:hypothetical protein
VLHLEGRSFIRPSTWVTSAGLPKGAVVATLSKPFGPDTGFSRSDGADHLGLSGDAVVATDVPMEALATYTIIVTAVSDDGSLRVQESLSFSTLAGGLVVNSLSIDGAPLLLDGQPLIFSV